MSIKINKEILKLAIPNILSNISVPLISSVDTGLMGGLSALHIGAVGLGAMIFNFIYWNFGFLRMGTTGMTAQAYGEKNKSLLTQLLIQGLIFSIIVSILFLVFKTPLLFLGVELLNIPHELYEYIHTYFNIRLVAAPATITLMVLMGWLFGMQNAIYPLIITIFINVLNIIVSAYLVTELDMEISGVAWGTVCAQYTGLILAIILISIKYSWLFDFLKQSSLKKLSAYRKFLSINADIFLRTFCLCIAFGFFFSQSAYAGAAVLAANTILMQFLNWMSFGVDGFAYAAESLCGKYKGSGDERSLKKAINYSMLWGMLLGICFSITYAFSGPFLLELFSDQRSIQDLAKVYLWWMILLPIIGTPCYIWDGIYIGLTAVKSMRNIMAVALLLYVVTYFSLRYFFRDEQYLSEILWCALSIFLLSRSILMWMNYQKSGIKMN